MLIKEEIKLSVFRLVEYLEHQHLWLKMTRNRRLTKPQLAASLNSTRKTPVSMSTVKRRLRDADLLGSFSVQCLCYFAHLNLVFLLASLRYGFFFATLPRRPASWSRLFTVDVETGVLRVLFNEAASRGLVRRLFLKLDTLMYLSSCSVVHRGLPLLSILVSFPCSVKGVVHSVIRDLQFLGNFSHGIAFISQNKKTLTSFRRKLF